MTDFVRQNAIETSEEAARVAWHDAIATGVAGGDLSSRQLAKVVAASLNGVRIAILALEKAVHDATAPPAAEVETVNVGKPPPLAGWAYVELMGRRVLPAAWVEEDDLAGRTMLRIRRLVRCEATNLPLGTPTPALELEERFRIYSPATIYSIEWITEADARERWLAWNGSTDRDDDIPF